MMWKTFGGFAVLGVFLGLGMSCDDTGADAPQQPDPEEDAGDDVGADAEDDASGDAGDNHDEKFAEGVMPEALKNGGYFDSTFINHAGDRIYFLHSIFSPKVLDGDSTPEQCLHLQAPQLPGHITAPDLEWNTDLYYVEWDGSVWSEPVNLGAPINTLGMECCVWLNADDTEIIFNRVSDLDGDGVDGDLGLSPTGNYIATRADRNSPWSDPVPLPGDYGTGAQTSTQYRHDIEKVPSGNLYLWEWFENGDNLLRFGERIGGTDADPVYASPVTIEGSTNFETQIWVNDTETRIVFNHRQPNGETELYTRSRATSADPWGAPETVLTPGFADSTGSTIWGEPSFDHSEAFMIFTRFNSSEPNCFTPELMYSAGDAEAGFSAPRVLN